MAMKILTLLVLPALASANLFFPVAHVTGSVADGACAAMALLAGLIAILLTMVRGD
jgi:hypothetical protein